MPDLEETPGPPKLNPVRRLARPIVALGGVILFQLLFVSVFAGVLHHPVLHQAPVAVAGRSPLAQLVSGHGGGTVRLVTEPTAGAARAALSGGQVNAAVIAGPGKESLLIQTAASPGTASVLTKEFTMAAAALKTPLQVVDLAPLPASDSTGTSLFFLVIAWMLGGYVGATALALMLGEMRSPGLRQGAIRLGLLAGYAVISGLLGVLLVGPVMGVVSGYSLSLPARSVVYLGGVDLTGPLTVLAAYAAAGTLLTLAATAWRRHRPASRAPQHAAQVASTAAEDSLAS